jgi:acetyl-CoA C-acetyltransferase
MSQQSDVVFASAVRTAIGNYGGSLKDKPATELAAAVVRESVRRAGVKPEDVGHVVFGNVVHTDVHDMYLARVAAIHGGLPVETPALTVNRLCGSGMQAIVSAAQIIKLGEAAAAVAGGVESMSRGQYWLPAMRWGQRMTDGKVVDAMVGALTDPFDDVHMAMTAEALAKKYGITREEQDQLAVESNRRAVEAIRQCVFKDQILPIELKAKTGSTFFDTDEKPRADATIESLSRLKPAFDKNGTVTAGNASGINDGAAAVVLMERWAADECGIRPIGRLVDWAYAGVDPKFMGIGPVPAVRKVLHKTGLKLDDIDVIELNEAFAAQALACIRELELPAAKTNPNGSGIALGHPIGATGAMLAVKALYELARIHGRYALVTMCIGGGQGIAAVIEGAGS